LIAGEPPIAPSIVTLFIMVGSGSRPGYGT
jgi:hypothetical protein